MLLLITCRSLELADRRMTTAITRLLAQPRGAGAPSWVRPWMGEGRLHRRAFPQRGASARRLRRLPCPPVAGGHWARKGHVSHAAAGHWAGWPGTRGTGWPPGQGPCLSRTSQGPSGVGPRAWATRPTAWRSAWPRRCQGSSTRPAPHRGVESTTARSGRAPQPPSLAAQATGRSSRGWASSPP